MKATTSTCFHDMPNGNGRDGAREKEGNKSALAGGGGGAATKDKAESAGGGPIKSAEEFEKEFMRDFVTDFDLDNLLTEKGGMEPLSVGALRKKYAGRMTDKEFEDYMYDLDEKGVLRLGTSSPSEKNNFPDAGGIKGMFDIKSVAQVDVSKIDKTAKPKPPTGKNPITSQKQFESEVEKAIKRIAKDGQNVGDKTPIHLIRKELGDNVTRSQFNKMMVEMQGGKWQLEKGNVSEASLSQVNDSVMSKRSGMRFFIKPAS